MHLGWAIGWCSSENPPHHCGGLDLFSPPTTTRIKSRPDLHATYWPLLRFGILPTQEILDHPRTWKLKTWSPLQLHVSMVRQHPATLIVNMHRRKGGRSILRDYRASNSSSTTGGLSLRPESTRILISTDDHVCMQRRGIAISRTRAKVRLVVTVEM